MSTTTTRRGGTIPELVTGLAALALLAALIIPGAARMRAESRTASSLSQLRWIAGTTNAYAADSADQFWGFWWKRGELPHSSPILPQFAGSDISAAAIQAIEILHRLGGRTDMALPTSWIPHPLFSHLVLADYAGSAVPNFNLIAPADKYRLAWARDPDAHDRGAFLPYQEPPSESSKRWPYTSSYLAPTTWWDLDDVATQGTSHRQYFIPAGIALGAPLMADVTYPSQKVMVHDSEQRERGSGPLYCVHPEARTAMMMADGSAGIKATADANPGWRPSAKTSADPTRFRYDPVIWEAPATSTDLMNGHYRWTRGGIKGRDFGGPEVDTGQP